MRQSFVEADVTSVAAPHHQQVGVAVGRVLVDEGHHAVGDRAGLGDLRGRESANFSEIRIDVQTSARVSRARRRRRSGRRAAPAAARQQHLVVCPTHGGVGEAQHRTSTTRLTTRTSTSGVAWRGCRCEEHVKIAADGWQPTATRSLGGDRSGASNTQESPREPGPAPPGSDQVPRNLPAP